ncbi:MAG: hypothetical protein ACFCU2_09350 [Acidimicrobiia bacterium]
MAVEPLNKISLRATSLADDLGFVALADLATALESDDEVPYRVIGGQMVMVLAARWGLGPGRDTRSRPLRCGRVVVASVH